jgi:hypothetical protein
MSFLQTLAAHFTTKPAYLGVSQAQDFQLAAIVRTLLPLDKGLEVYVSLRALAEAPDNSLAIFAPKHLFSGKELRELCFTKKLSLLLWDNEELLRGTPGFTWIIRWEEAPKEVPFYGVDNLKRAAASPLSYFTWQGNFLAQSLQEAFPSEKVYWANAQETFQEIKRQAKEAENFKWAVWQNIENAGQVSLIKIALSDAAFPEKNILLCPRQISPKDVLIRGEASSLEKTIEALKVNNCPAPGRMAALTALEPEAIHLCKNLLYSGHHQLTLETNLKQANDPGMALKAKFSGLNLQTDSLRFRQFVPQQDETVDVSPKALATALYENALYFMRESQLQELPKSLREEAKNFIDYEALALLDLEEVAFFVNMNAEVLAKIAHEGARGKSPKQAAKAYQNALQAATQENLPESSLALLRLGLAREQIHFDCVAAQKNIDEANKLESPTFGVQLKSTMVQAALYAKLGHPKLETWLRPKLVELATNLGDVHEKLSRLQKLLQEPLDNFTKNISRLRIQLSSSSKVLYVASLFFDFVADKNVTTTRLEDNQVRVNPYLISSEQGLGVMARALLQALLLQAYDPENPENQGEIEAHIKPFERIVVPAWVRQLDTSRDQFAATAATKEEAISRWSLVMQLFENYRNLNDEALCKKLQEKGLGQGEFVLSNKESLSKKVAAILSGDEHVTVPEITVERFFIVVELSQRPETTDQAINAFRWLVDRFAPEWVQLFGNNMMLKMRELKLQGMVAIAIQKELRLRKFLTDYQNLLGLSGSVRPEPDRSGDSN